MEFNDWLILSVTGINAQWTSGRHTAADTLRDDVILLIVPAASIFECQNGSNLKIALHR